MSYLLNNPSPNFEGYNQYGQKINEQTFPDRKIILYFYPSNNTPTCTKQALHFKEECCILANMGYTTIGINTESVASHHAFATKHRLPFHLLSDPEKKIHRAYHTWVEKKHFGKTYWGTARKTFVIDEKRYIIKIIDQVNATDHVRQILC